MYYIAEKLRSLIDYTYTSGVIPFEYNPDLNELCVVDYAEFKDHIKTAKRSWRVQVFLNCKVYSLRDSPEIVITIHFNNGLVYGSKRYWNNEKF
jgi:hypothetical protein